MWSLVPEIEEKYLAERGQEALPAAGSRENTGADDLRHGRAGTLVLVGSLGVAPRWTGAGVAR